MGLTTAVAYGYRTLHRHPAFALDSVEIRGASTKTATDLRALLAERRGANLFQLDLSSVREEVEKHPWVETAMIQSHLPNKLTLFVIERTPAGLARRGDRVEAVSADGQRICDYHDYSMPLDLPVIIGLERTDAADDALRKGLRTLAAIKEASLLFWDNLETLDVSDPENMIARLRSQSAPINLGGELIPANLGNYLAIADHIQSRHPDPVYIELGFPNQIAVMPKQAAD